MSARYITPSKIGGRCSVLLGLSYLPIASQISEKDFNGGYQTLTRIFTNPRSFRKKRLKRRQAGYSHE
ncbi:hypothetical protein V6N12_064663 [Hibiscus sabdariffa]|uniref:Uncharacterized protein n=1 Tax=Hibiscus sabdariffa TaxID=183260 RepID=A0ABR2G7I2_9ROSI